MNRFSEHPASTVIQREEHRLHKLNFLPHIFPFLSYYKQQSLMRQLYNNKYIYKNPVKVTHTLTEYRITPKAYYCLIRNPTDLHEEVRNTDTVLTM